MLASQNEALRAVGGDSAVAGCRCHRLEHGGQVEGSTLGGPDVFALARKVREAPVPRERAAPKGEDR